MNNVGDVLPASSLWRRNVLVTGRRFKKELLEFTHLTDRSIDHISTAVAHNKTNHLMLFDTSTKRDVMKVVKLNKEGSSAKWKVTNDSIQECPASICSASWHDDQLLCSGLDGQIYMYNCDPMSGADAELQAMYTITKLKGVKETSFSVGSCAMSTAIRGVSINTQSPSTFACVENQSFHIWDVANPVQPIVTYRASDAPMHCLEWSKHSRHYCAVGGDENTIRVLDQRQLSAYSAKRAPVSWSSNQCDGNVQCVSWHPFVPYWLASATSTGAIEIFDLRSISKPVISFYGHNGPVTSINWCPTNSELMVSSGYDCVYNMWNLSMQPNYLLFQKDEGGPYVYSSFFGNDGYNNFSVNQSGELTYTNVSQKFMNPFINSKFQDKSEVGEKRVERLIYNREFVSGFEKAIILANKHSRNNNVDKAHTLLTLCFQSNLEDSLSDVLKSTLPRIDMTKEFIKDMESFAYFIPPTFYEKFGTKLSTSLMTKIKDLKINLDIQKHIKISSGEELVEIEREMLSTLRGDHLSIRIETIVDVVQVLLNYDAVKCYNFVIQLTDIFKNKLNFMLPILRVLFYPSIFSSPDTSTNNESGSTSPPTKSVNNTPIPSPLIKNPITSMSAPTSLRNSTSSQQPSPMIGRAASLALRDPSEVEEQKINEHLGSADLITQQFTYLREFVKKLNSPTPVGDGSNDDEDIIDYSSRNRPPVILSMAINRIYLSILAESFIYDQFFIVLLTLLGVCDGFEFHAELKELYEVFTPDFLAYIKASQTRDRTRPWDSERYSTPLLTCISILCNVTVANMPQEFYDTLSEAIPIFTQELDNSLVSMLQTPDPSIEMSGKLQSQQKAQTLYELVKSITNETIHKQSNVLSRRGSSTPAASSSSGRVTSTSISPQQSKANMTFQNQIQSLDTILNKYK